MNKAASPVRMGQVNSMSQHEQTFNVNSQNENKGLEGMMSNNLMLSNWLNNVKNNNVNLYDSMTGNNVSEHLLNQNSMDRFTNRN